MATKKVYMYVTNDKYRLPIYTADSIKELAEKVGVSRHSISSQLCKFRQKKIHDSQYVEVVVEDDE